MNIVINGRKINLDDSFKGLVTKKLSRLEKLFGDDANARVVVSKTQNSETVEVTIVKDGNIYRAESVSSSRNESIDKALKALARQMRKHKTRLSKRFKGNVSLDDILPSEDCLESLDEPIYNVVKSKEFAIKPMSTEEAILELDMLGHPFFIFKDAQTDLMNVIYKRNDGKYGLLVPKD